MRPFGLRVRNSGVRVLPASMSSSVQSIVDAELREQQAHLVAVARIQVVEEVHACLPASVRRQVCRPALPAAIEKACRSG